MGFRGALVEFVKIRITTTLSQITLLALINSLPDIYTPWYQRPRIDRIIVNSAALATGCGKET
jgi:hypothetical protein